ncbi:MAG: M15 family metallopeptidase [Acidobacteria bacterium]|nr:M15 family metallopeptidase [Acidobacteriota bacterium]
MNPNSYLDKTFVVNDPDARIRQADLVQFETYQNGDELPPGKQVGDVKIIPVGTEVRLTAAQVGSTKRPFVFAEAAAEGGASFGWTAASNLKGKLVNETIGLMPAKAELSFKGNNRTVTDEMAFVREGPPNFTSTGDLIAAGTFVVVTETQGKFSKVSHGEAVQGEIVVGDEIGWTASSNLTDGWSDRFGPNAAWDHGNFVGQKDLVNIVGAKDQTEQVTADSLDHYLALAQAAKAAGIALAIESGFRSFPHQKFLFDGFIHHRPGFNRAAVPGRSNHQHGQAFDLNTGGFDGDPTYNWLKRNAPALGFIRTVSKEHWHWEFRPNEANHPPGKFKSDGVDP